MKFFKGLEPFDFVEVVEELKILAIAAEVVIVVLIGIFLC